jgi:hypothetical protein
LSDESETKSGNVGSAIWGVVIGFVEIVVREIVKLATAFVFGTAVGAIFTWYFGLPLAYALGGGLIMVIIVIALMPDSIFSG